MTRVWLALASTILLTACDQVFGLTPLDQAPSDASADSADAMAGVTGRLVTQYAHNNSAFVPIVSLHNDPTATITVRLDDGASVAVDFDVVSGQFAFPISAGKPYALVVTTAGKVIEYQHTAPTLAIVEKLAGRVDAAIVTKVTNLHFDINSSPDSGGVVVSSTGIWTQSVTGSVTNPLDFDWKNSITGGGPPGLLDANEHDQLFYTRGAIAPEGYAFVSSVKKTSITLVDGATSAVTGLAIHPENDLCVTIDAPRGDEYARILAAVPGTYEASGSDWRIDAIPALSLGPVGNLFVAFGTATPPANEVGTVVWFNNPYFGSQLVAASGAGMSRPIAVGSAAAIGLPFGTRIFAPIASTDDCVANHPVLTNAVGLAATIVLDGIALAVDDTAFEIDRTRAPIMQWFPSAPVDVTYVSIFEVTAGSGTTTLVPLMRIVTTDQRVRIDPALFESDHRYIVRFDTELGIPNARSGDFDTVQYPHALGTTWSHSFHVQ